MNFNRHFLVGCVVTLFAMAPAASAQQIRITLPKGSKVTPVQQLNRDGVEALRKNQFEKARDLFYKAYLFDPDDPFTLNNLGYISELEGQVDRAQQFYSLAAAHSTDAVVDVATSQQAEGKPMASVTGTVPDTSIQVNRANVEAIRLMNLGRAPEADLLLQQTLALEPGNAFSLNNYAVAKEMEGDYSQAVKYYKAAAETKSDEKIIVTLNKSWRGKPVSEMAADSVKRVEQRMRDQETLQAQVRRLNLQGVSALNRNSYYDARQFFQQAYKLDPDNAFSLNNRGFLAEMDGDQETAKFFYEKARRSAQANSRIGFANNRTAEGKKLFEVADENDQKMDTKMAEIRESRKRQAGAGPVQLRRRDGTVVTEPEPTATPAPANAQPQNSPTLGPPQPQIPQLTPRPTTTPEQNNPPANPPNN